SDASRNCETTVGHDLMPSVPAVSQISSETAELPNLGNPSDDESGSDPNPEMVSLAAPIIISDELTEGDATDSPYGFPTVDISAAIKAASTEWLLDELDRLCNCWGPRRIPPAPYKVIRDSVCQISLELNLRGKNAPRFRQ